MRKKQVKGKAGNAAQYITRNQALKKLQLKLSEFRRLCILKGIHPREPRKKPAGRHKTYYHVKDILFLAHEPLLNKFRADAAFERRVRKARAKKGDEAAKALEAERPVHRLDHLIRERYPTFNDALRDLDDPLSLVHLFAALPSDSKAGVPPAAVAASRTLATEWAAWCARSHSLRKAFISVKGYYFQASVRGNTVTWLTPHALAQVLPPDVDFKVMATFLELACTTLRHVLARLYADLGSPYPPRADAALDGAAAGLEALMRGLAAAAAASAAAKGGGGEGGSALASSAPATPTLLLGGSSLNGKRERRRARRAAERAAAAAGGAAATANDESSDDDEGEDAGENDEGAKAARLAALPAKAAALAAEAGDGPASSSQQEKQATAPPASSSDAGAGSSLFRGLVFYIAREVPREPLLLLLRSFGADAVSWEGPGAPLKVDDPRITHAIVDKPPAVPSSNRGGGASTAPPPLPPRASVVPQWAFDSANFRVRADERRYLPGRRPPPHLSPFADAADDGGYVPAYAEELKALREASSSAARGARAVAAKDALAEFEAAAAAVAERGGSGDASAGAPAADGGGGEKAPDAIDADEAAAAAAHAEGLAKELGMSLPTTAKSKKAAAKVSGDDGDDDAVESAADVAKAADADRMRAAMLPRKKRHLYESVRKAQDAKKARGEKLAEKAAAVASK